jgi:hypothetical protein
MLLGEILMREGVLRSEQLEEALAAQMIYGGRIGTNLVECGFATEAQIASALARQHGVPSAHGEIAPSPQALASLPTSFMDEHGVLPARLEGGTLYLLVVDPGDVGVQDQVARATGKRVVPIVIAELRMAHLLRRYAGAFRPVRGLGLQAARPTSREPAAPDLISEADFQALYAAVAGGGGRAAPLAGEGAPEVDDLPQIAGVALDEGGPGAPPASEGLTPMTFSEAQAAVQGAADRDGVAKALIRCAASGFQRALLFQVHGESATGWMAAGASLPPRAVPAIALSLATPSAFKLVRDSRSHFLGPLRVDAATAPLFEAMGGAPRTAALLPILAVGRVVNILYGDNGPDQHATPELGELLILAQGVGRAYEALIAQRRSAFRARNPQSTPGGGTSM